MTAKAAVGHCTELSRVPRFATAPYLTAELLYASVNTVPRPSSPIAMKRFLSVGLLGVFAPTLLPACLAAQTLELTASPSTATMYRVKPQDNSLIPLGAGAAKFKLEKNDPNTIVVRQEGFRDVRRSFPKDVDYKDKRFTIFLSKRIVTVAALPYDATIYVNGEPRGQRQLEVEVDEGGSATVELRSPGFAPVKRVYRWEKGSTQYPVASDRFELVDRRVSVMASPAGAEIYVGESKMGDGDADVVVARGGCTTVRVQKTGWSPTERQYCNKEGLPDTPASDRVTLSGRLVSINAPAGARIFVNQKQAGTGSFAVKIADGTCVKVRVEQPGFVSWDQELCSQDNAPVPQLEYAVELEPDESYAASVASDQANVNITVEVGPKVQEVQAWKLLSSIVLGSFDILENSDSQTGYLRTAWQTKSWAATGTVIRTRIIVKRQSDSPLRYVVKIVSEHNKDARMSSSEDENFYPWDRLLNSYKDVISEMQARLK